MKKVESLDDVQLVLEDHIEHIQGFYKKLNVFMQRAETAKDKSNETAQELNRFLLAIDGYQQNMYNKFWTLQAEVEKLKKPWYKKLFGRK